MTLSPHPLSIRFSGRSRRALPVFAAMAMLLGCAACDQPLAVAFNPAGAKDLSLKGEIGVTGTTTRSLIYNGKTYDKGVKVAVYETFLVRREGGRPPSYHFEGLYDPVKKADKFVLPTGTIDTFYYSVLEPHRKEHIPVPKEYFKRDP